MAYTDSAEIIEALAADIGDNIYMDIAKWHLYLRDAKLHTALAEQLYPMLSDDISEDAVQQVLRNISIKLGGGRKTVTLADLLPVQCQVNLMDILEDYQKKL
ncbi:MAG: DUF3181 family protein [Leptolyngbya sp. SIO4C1]|nr:DUF3181 family protein [Leptolyngbya sp. SIO4C1]